MFLRFTSGSTTRSTSLYDRAHSGEGKLECLVEVWVAIMGGKYNDLVYTGMSIYQYIPVYTPGSYLLDLPLRFQ